MASDYGAALLQDDEAHWERAEVVSKLYDGEGCELVERWFWCGVGLCEEGVYNEVYFLVEVLHCESAFVVVVLVGLVHQVTDRKMPKMD